MNVDSAWIPAHAMSSRMQGKIQETLGQVGSSTRTQLENMRQAWDRVSSMENDNGLP